MAHWTPKLLTSRSARRRADLHSILYDLDFSNDCACELLKNQNEMITSGFTSKCNSVVVRALWNAALISYRRCFSEGNRFWLSRDYACSNFRFHADIYDAANKYVAHSVNSYEIYCSSVYTAEKEEKLITGGLGFHMIGFIAPSATEIENFIELTTQVKGYVKILIKELEEEIKIEIAKMSVGDLQSLPDAFPPHTISSRSIRKWPKLRS